jgi:Alpha/beta hydrolase domain
VSGPRRRLALVTAVLGAIACAAPGAATATPVPKITGPLPSTAGSYPFGAAEHQMVPQNLRREGYVEEEYFLSGKANVYSWPAPGPAVVRTAGAPYTTRALVRRPANRARFSGNVVVELLNPSNLFDLNIGWALTHRQILRNGDAWVGITIRPISVEALKTFDPRRYAPLSFANPLPLSDPANCNVNGQDSRLTERGLVWDMFSQAGAWVRSRAHTNPLTYGSRKSDPVKQVYGFGYSQTGGYLYNYINGIQPLVVASDGRPIFDGYLVVVAGGAFVGAVPMNQCEAAPPVGDPRRQFQNVGVPIIHVMSQSDYLGGIDARRPDSDAPSDPFRHYEMAGAGHATPDELYYSAAPQDIVKAGQTVPPLTCNEGPRSRFPSSIFLDAALLNLERWAKNGIGPPHSDPILVSNGQPVLDEHGNVMGGLRSPFLDVPTSTWLGSSTGASFCFIAGHEVPFSPDKLRRLYPSHGRYVEAVAKDVLNLVRQRIITAPDGVGLVRDAAHAHVP